MSAIPACCSLENSLRPTYLPQKSQPRAWSLEPMAVLFLLPLLLEIPKQRDQIVTISAYDPDNIGPKANFFPLVLTLFQQFAHVSNLV
jgi:hypothetical protein